MFFEDRADNVSLNADPFAVDDADFLEAALDRLIQKLFHNRAYFFGLKRVQVDRVFDRDFVHGLTLPYKRLHWSCDLLPYILRVRSYARTGTVKNKTN